MAAADDDTDVLAHIAALVGEETRLREELARSPGDQSDRIRRIEAQLDQCWDLLRQRRAKREFGDDPASARPRSIDTVERYEN